jgi:hypothetical protein
MVSGLIFLASIQRVINANIIKTIAASRVFPSNFIGQNLELKNEAYRYRVVCQAELKKIGLFLLESVYCVFRIG